MKFGVVIFPGSNCELDTIYVISEIIKRDVVKIWHKDKYLPDVQCIVLPGGFAFGDYLRPGAIASHSPIMQPIKEYVKSGGLVLGVCNGFQVLTEADLLPGALIRNIGTRFVSKKIKLKVENNNTPFTSLFNKGEIIELPIAHKDGNYYAPGEVINEIKANNGLVLSYIDNPNGSAENIAGIVNKQCNVFGLMPHPERAYEEILGSDAGLRIFSSIVNYLES
ncbi:MAG: phosphoribosylformylglycinamidine synthase subunit PurQ [Caldisericia bacterium]|nr:phosphoribosylformylglycinamidine synthase subunit PurQ [Caldisericia bacterium]MDD3427830.1 phosphoribosylformylglycinamidine synthase subunit PurQ [Caldisericia bacterium]MDD5689586.1 phosphoribosylformylglycinamidine synthase subunit PurQ [Caldisericia bacterium]HOJ16415.1 phosphoribosylformylglycinamidine synthase subunit PurQ [Caldisericia bacterium]HOW03202.1 phosphoribosylformylglycinamidine synthase subunit PurQ [Caldisericia bacterium]